MKLRYCIIDTCCCVKQSFKNCCLSISNRFKKLFTRKKYVNIDEGETHLQNSFTDNENNDTFEKNPENNFFIPYYDGKLSFDKNGNLVIK